MIQEYRKIPVTIQAVQWTGKNEEELFAFTGGRFSSDQFGPYEDPDRRAGVYDELHTTWVQLTIGDFIIRGVRGEFYPCNESVFYETYEKPFVEPKLHSLDQILGVYRD